MTEIAKSEKLEIKKISLGVAATVSVIIVAIGLVGYHLAVHKKDDEEKAEKSKEQ